MITLWFFVLIKNLLNREENNITKISNKFKLLVILVLILALTACTEKPVNKDYSGTNNSGLDNGETTRVIIDGGGREVEIPENVESIVCINVGSLRYTSYMDAQELVIGVEDYEKEQSEARPYNYINYDVFKDLPIIGSNGEQYLEEIIAVNPDVIMMSSLDSGNADFIQNTTGIPVVLIPGSDKMMDEDAYETIRIMGEVYKKEERAKELTDYLDSIKKDLQERTADIPEESKPTVYVGGLSFKGHHGLEGTEALYGPLHWINAKNLANETEQTGPFNMDLEQILAWDPDVLFVDFNGIPLINEHYETNPEFYKQLKAVKEEKVYSQISFRSYAANLDMALANTYYIGSILYPEKFADINPIEKADEIFNKLLGSNFYDVLKGRGYEF